MPLSITKKSLLLGLTIPLAMSLLFFALNAVSLAAPPEAIARNLARSFAASQIPETDYSHYDTAHGVNQYNDCLIAEMALLRDENFTRNVVSPRVLVVKGSHWQPDRNSVCSILHRLIQGEAPDDILASSDAFETYHYHRYLHGHRMLANLMLSSLTMGQVRTVLQASVLATLALLGGLSLWRAFRLRRPGLHGIDPDYPLASAVMALGFGTFYGLQFYGMSLSHAPSEVVLLVLSALVPNGGMTTILLPPEPL